MTIESGTTPTSTPIEVVANVARVVTRVVDRLAGDRSEVPLLVAAAVERALRNHGIQSRVMYGPCAWIEVLEDQSPAWAGCWDGNFSFWVATQFGEVVDLNVSVAHRKRAHAQPGWKSMYSPPMLWASEVPRFYRYQPDGVAEVDLTDVKDKGLFEKVLAEVDEKCRPAALVGGESEFPNEPILCPGRKLLDDSRETWRHFDRALSVWGVPQAPF